MADDHHESAEVQEESHAVLDDTHAIDENPAAGTALEPIRKPPALKQEEDPAVFNASDGVRDLTTRALDFLSHASNETLTAIVIGLGACTYLVLGRFGLVLIGTVVGVGLHATWEGNNGRGQAGIAEKGRRRKEMGTEIVRRTLDWADARKLPGKETASGAAEKRSADTSKAAGQTGYDDFKPATKGALDTFTDAVVRDYVKWWYSPILPEEESFPEACRATLVGFIRAISNHLSKKRAVDPFLDFLANSASIVIVFLNELSTALQASQRQTPEESIRTYLHYQPDSNLANVLDITQQDRKLKLVADDILQTYTTSSTYNCPPVKAFLQQILSGLILEQVIEMAARPEYINSWIVWLFELEPELSNIIDSGIEGATECANDASEPEENKGHRRRVSKAEEAMQQAMVEAQRLNEMIAEEDSKKLDGSKAIVEDEDGVSIATTEGGAATPTSSDSERNRNGASSLGQSRDSEDFAGFRSKTVASTTSDQLGSPHAPIAVQPSYTTPVSIDSPAEMLTLHNASITILDDADPRNKNSLKQKPTTEYLLQIEPKNSRFPGWMVTSGRNYDSFAALHETLRRISIISGVPEFAQQYAVLPGWKGRTAAAITQELERYLRFALQHEPLAESEAMRKFLEKSTGLQKAPASKKVLGFQNPAALDVVGKGIVNVFGQADKAITGGGKAVLGGVTGVFGAVATGIGGQKKSVPAIARRPNTGSVTSLSRADSYGARQSQDASRTHSSLDINKPPALPSRPPRRSTELVRSRSSSRSRQEQSDENLNLPPPPSDMPEDYPGAQTPSKPELPPRAAVGRPATPTRLLSEVPATWPIKAVEVSPSISKTNGAPLTEEETRVCVELMFAIITELYSLSSAWTIRLNLLTVAKGFLLRPQNPQLESIRTLLQDSVIDANFSDEGLAAHIYKLRENALPTVEELKKWPPEPTALEKEKLRVKARKLLAEKGMPQALTSVMGAAASGEALGRVFDCLQIKEVARGLVFALLLSALRGATH